MSTGGRPHATLQPRERGYDEDTFTCSGNGGLLLSSSREQNLNPATEFFWTGYSAAFCVSGHITGWLGFTMEKNQVPEPKGSITRLGPSAAKHGWKESLGQERI
jgi:hypothetical protein